MQIDENRVMQKLQQNPRKVLDAVRRGSKQEMVEIANFWLNMGPELLHMDLLPALFGHLKSSSVPAASPNNRANSPAAERAFFALVALTKLGNIVAPLHPAVPIAKVEAQVMEGWEGVFKWCAFLYSVRVAPGEGVVPAELRRTAMDIIGGVLYSLSRSDKVRQAMLDTEGSIELATRLWISEDSGPIPTKLPIPVGTASLDALLTIPDWNPATLIDGDVTSVEAKRRAAEIEVESAIRTVFVRSMLDRVVTAAGGSASDVVELAMSRLRAATGNNARMHEPHSALSLDLIGHLSRSAEHPLRLGFLGAGMTLFVTKLAVKIGGLLQEAVRSPGRPQIGFGSMTPASNGNPRAEGLQEALVACLGFLHNTLESTDGFSWVVKAVNGGLLQAWISAARNMHRFASRDDADMILDLLSKLVTKYMTYKSVVTAVDGAMKKVQNPNNVHRDWKDPKARKVWQEFRKLGIERYLVTLELKEVKKKAAICNSVKCQKIDFKNNFRKCSACSTTLYCSKECQADDWKASHKVVCKLKQQEFLEGKYQSIPKGDSDYFHHLSTYDARHNSFYLRQLAEKKYPAIASDPSALVITIDYMKMPPIFSLYPLDEHDKHAPQLAPDASRNAEARNEELIQRVRENPGKYAIIQSKIANGQGMQLVNSIVTGAFWQKEGWIPSENVFNAASEDSDDEFESRKAVARSRIRDLNDLDASGSASIIGRFMRLMDDPAGHVSTGNAPNSDVLRLA
ncbi:hypothetical protein CPB84DRAFT_1793000 [Gymnopilus junonius]|uniref:MYND-type domain-containing protein n=1 Tax=Gymnopilus junonius TaxID=109634 RepID=A0A9P5NBA6_GYMJU|nr:hypothetical protein CPB84DRAFT_1793000 [Gymnopilus junonius]